MMRKAISGFLFIAALAVFLLGASTSHAYMETFDSDNSGWLNVTVNDGGATPNIDSVWITDGEGKGFRNRLCRGRTSFQGISKYSKSTDSLRYPAASGKMSLLKKSHPDLESRI